MFTGRRPRSIKLRAERATITKQNKTQVAKRQRFLQTFWVVDAAKVEGVMDWVQHLVGHAVPAIVEGGGLVLRRQRHHHQIVAGARDVQQDDHGTDSRGLAH